MRLAILLAVLATAVVVAAGLTAPRGHGGAWDDDGSGGHGDLAQRLADDHPVFAVESSLALLPTSAGSGDTLFLFPTHRPASEAEVRRVQEFLHDGGLLVMAADGSNADAWAGALGVNFKGLPALLPPDAEVDCVPARVPQGVVIHDVCLPSPTTFPDLDRLADGDVSFSHVSYSEMPVFLDADLDGRLSAGDQGPVVSPMVLQWDLGAAGGRVVAVADGDVWRNGVVRDHPGNLEFAQALAGDGDVFLDSSGVQPTVAARLANPGYRLLSGPDAIGNAVLALLLLGTAVAVRGVPRITPLRVHAPPPDASDPRVTHAALEVLHEYLHAPEARRTRPTRPDLDDPTRMRP